MDRAAAFALFMSAERRLIAGERRIARLQKIVVQFRHDGSFTREKAARDLLFSVKSAQRAQEARRDQLRSLVSRADAERAVTQLRFRATR